MIGNPPIYEVLAEQDGKAKLAWILFFQAIVAGDTGTAWTPTATNLTTSGTPTITGRYFTNQGFTDFWIKIVPSVSVSGTNGSYYFDLPFLVTNDAPCFAVSGLSSASGAVDSATKRCYPPTLSTVTAPITITGRVVSQ